MSSAHGQSVAVTLDDSSKLGDARRRTASLTEGLGFDDTQCGTAALLVTEAASNLLKHAGGGELIVQAFGNEKEASSLEILAIDSGPGIADLARCVVDGYSTAGSPGTGLGAMRRLADAFEIYSSPGLGTVVRARIGRAPRAKTLADGRDVGVVWVAAPGEEVCGDGWATADRENYSFSLLVDGLGHGPAAAEAATEAVRVFSDHTSLDPGTILESLHAALRSTRGAAVGIARLDHANHEVSYAGIGNISGVVLDRKTGATSRMVSQNGTVGYTIRKIQVFRYPWSEESLLVMHSDGLGTHWDLGRYPGLLLRHPSLVASVLYRDHKRGRDDVTVLAVGPGRPPAS